MPIARRGPTVALAALSLALLAGQAPAQEKPSRDQIEYGTPIDGSSQLVLEKMLDVWSQKLGTTFVVDPHALGTRVFIHDAEKRLTWGLMRKVLEFHDIVIEERQSEGRTVTYVHHRRNLSQRVPPPFRIVAPGEALPQREEVVTAFVPVKNGAGPDIFATLRGLLTRDMNRIGNILYVRGPETIIVSDFAANVDYYSKLIRQLDDATPVVVPKIYKLTHAPAADVEKAVKTLLGLAPPAQPPVFLAPGQPIPAPSVVHAPESPLRERRVVTDPRTNQLVVVALPSEHAQLAPILAALDKEIGAPEPK